MFYGTLSGDYNVLTIMIRASQDPVPLGTDIRSRVRSIDPNIAVNWIEPVTNLIRKSFAEQRYRTLLIMIFALSAVFLAVVGLYGVISRYVAYRKRELGVRLAIGAAPRNVLTLVLRKGLLLTVCGMAGGSIGAVWLTRILADYLFGITPLDLGTYAGVALLLLSVSLIAAYGPARRASRIDPVECLRAE